MPTLNIEGKRVRVDDAFLKLSPEDQNAQVEEIAASIRDQGGQKPAPSTGLGAAAADAVTEIPAGMIEGPQSLIDAIPGVSGAYKAGEEALKGSAWENLTPRAVAKYLHGMVDYQRDEDASAAGVNKHLQEGDYGAAAASAGKAALTSVIESAPSIALATRNPAAALMSEFGQNVQARKDANGTDEADLGDLAAAGLGAAAETVLDVTGGRLIRGVVGKTGSKAARAGKAAVGGLAVEAGEGPINLAATREGTEQDPSAADYALSAEDALLGAAGQAGRRVAGDTARAAVTRVTGGKTAGQVKAELKANPNRVLSDARIEKAVERVKRESLDENDREAPDADSRALGTVQDELKGVLRSAADTFLATGLINRSQHHDLVTGEDSPIRLAERHNRLLTTGALDRIDEMPAIGPEIAQKYREAVVDLDNAANNRQYRRQVGPAAAVGGMVGAAAGAFAGKAGVGRVTGQYLGGKVDRMLGVGSPKPIRDARKRAPYLEEMGVNVGEAGDGLQEAQREVLKYFGDLHGVTVDGPAMAKMLAREKSLEAAKAKRQRAQDARKEEARARKEAAQLQKEHEELLRRSAQLDADYNRPIKELSSGQILRAQRGLRGMVQPGPTPDIGDIRPVPLRQIQGAQGALRGDYEVPPSLPLRQIQAAQAGIAAWTKQAERARLIAEQAERETVEAEREARAAQAVLDAENSTPRAGGWHLETVSQIRDRFQGQLKVSDEDLVNGLKAMVQQGKMSEAAAKIALEQSGARIEDKTNPRLFLELQDEVVASALRRANLPVTREVLVELVQGNPVAKAKEQGRLRIVREESAKAEKRRIREEAKAISANSGSGGEPKKPRAPRKPKAAAVVDEGVAAQAEKGDQDRRTASYRANIDTGQAAARAAQEGAPTPELGQAAANMEAMSDLDARKALYDAAVASTKDPAHLRWAATTLYPLTMFGPGGKAIRSAHAKAYGGLHDPDLVDKAGRLKSKKKTSPTPTPTPAAKGPPKVGGDKVSARDAVLGSIEGQYENSLVIDEDGVIWRLPHGKGHEALKRLDPNHTYVELHTAGTDGAGAGRPDGKPMTEPQKRRIREMEAEFKRANGGVPLQGGYIVMS